MARIIFVCCALVSCVLAADPLAVYVTWQDDPSSSMVVQWITPAASKKEDKDKKNEKAKKSKKAKKNKEKFTYCKAKNTKNKKSWKKVSSVVRPFFDGQFYSVHTVRLSGLSPKTSYRFRREKGAQLSYDAKKSFLPSDVCRWRRCEYEK